MADARGVRRKARGASLRGTDFVRAVVAATRAATPARLGPFHTSAWSYLGKVWTGNRDLHYEIWLRPRVATLEVGLHFEADPLTNARLLGAFRSREADIRAALGRAPLIEEWDRGWTRVYESLPLTEDAETAARCGARLAAYVRALEPILREELPVDVPWRTRARASARTR